MANLRRRYGNASTLIFMVVLSFICSMILAVLASALQPLQERAKELDRSRQMLIAAKILDHDGHFLLPNDKGGYRYAMLKGSKLVPGDEDKYATSEEIMEVVSDRIVPMLMNPTGELVTFEKAGINKNEYISENKKKGYYTQKYKLIYEILPNDPKGDSDPIGYVVPVNGFGLWDAIYGYIAIEPNGDNVIGISWYEQSETPGLGANITEPDWQSQFPGKDIFQATASGEVNSKTSPMGIVVVKGKVSEVMGDSPKAKSAVDGMAGATLTGNGVTDAYKSVLSAYRPFFSKLYQQTHEGAKA